MHITIFINDLENIYFLSILKNFDYFLTNIINHLYYYYNNFYKNKL